MAPLPTPAERSSPWLDVRTLTVLLAVGAVVGRVLLDPGGSLLGHVFSEAPGHLWMQWLLDRALWDGADWWGQRDVLLQETLWVVPLDWSNRLVAFVLGPILGAVRAFNVTMIGLVVLMAVGMLRICRRLDAGPMTSALAVLLFVWSPSVLGFAADGRIDSLCMGWMAMFLAAWIDAMRQPTWRSGVWMGVWAMAVSLSGPNPAFVLAFLAAIPSVVALVQDRSRWRPLLITGLMAALALAFVLGMLISVEGNDPKRLEQVAAPDVRPFLEFLLPEEILERRLKAVWSGAANLNRFAPTSNMWQLPEVLRGIQATQIGTDRLTVQPFAPGGWWRVSLVPWILAFAGTARRPRAAAPWMGLGVLTLFLGLGHGHSQTLPFMLGSNLFYISPASVLEAVPGFSVFNNYGLFSSASALCVAVTVAVGWKGARRAPVIAGIAALLWFIEVQRGPVPLPLATADTTLPEGLVEMLASGDPSTGVVTLPLSKDHNNYLQTLHGRPTPVRFRLHRHTPNRDGMIVDPTGNINLLLNVARGRGPDPTLENRLVKAGVGHVLVFSALMPEAKQHQVRSRLSGALGSPVWTDGSTDLYVVRQ
ncbi:MAG TPA: hypothetical protein DFR83_01880 [Deltaproteobacteria bacterium]|nr:hypothetical protein [Deltaproteobacteria bacterium]